MQLINGKLGLKLEFFESKFCAVFTIPNDFKVTASVLLQVCSIEPARLNSRLPNAFPLNVC